MPRQGSLQVQPVNKDCQSKMIMSERIKEFYTVRDQLDTLKIHSKMF